MTDGYVTVRDVAKQFGDTWAVKEVSFTAQAGEFVTLLGPSGCGKTTTLRLIAGFEEPDRGDIFIGGQRINKIPPWRRQIGVVFQNYALFPHLTVYDNIAFGLRRRHLERHAVEQRVGSALDLVNLPGLERRYPRQLSGGQQQRVALARALVLQPRVLLLDEPLSNLDARLRTEMRFELKQIQRNSGVTTIFVTHDQEEALTMSDQIVVMSGGEVQQIGTPQSVWETPQNAFVAHFLGVDNRLSAEVVERLPDQQMQVRLQASGALLLCPSIAGAVPGSNVILAIRAHDMLILEDMPHHPHNAFKVTVRETNYQGESTSYQVISEAWPRPLTVTVSTKRSIPDQFWLCLPPDQLMVFTAGSSA